ncbi:MAG TPA: CHAD domain-containing protein [Aliidongia sp.]|nr:CHAD domain-containing protein [Aliidongia sp.]
MPATSVIMAPDSAPLDPPPEAIETVETPSPPPEVHDLHLLLVLEEASVPALRKAKPLAASLRRPSTRKLHQIFWDTADFRLGRAGLATAIQNQGRRRSQIVRPVARRPTGGDVRPQTESPVGADRPDIARLALMPGFDPSLLREIASADLVPVFAIDLSHTHWTIRWRDTELLVTLEAGTIETARGRGRFHQLDLALQAGPAAGLYDFALSLHGEVPLRLATHEPAQRGYALAAGEDWWPDRAGAVELRRSMSVRDGVLAIGRAAAADFRAETGTLETGLQPERIHQARVAIRRLRSLLTVFRDVLPPRARMALAQDLGGLASMLGHAREWDVFLAETLEPMIKAVGDGAGFGTQRFAAAVLREEAADRALAAIKAPGFMAISLTLAAWFDAGIWPEPPTAEMKALLASPLEAFATRLLRKRHRKLLAAVERLKDPRPQELHQIRIGVKKLRYTAEFMHSLFPAKPFRQYLAGLKELQQVLGTLNDADVARKLALRLSAPNKEAGAHLAGLITGWTAAEMAAATKRLGEAWADFAETKRFWK